MAILVSWIRVAQASLAGELPMDTRLLPRELSNGAGLWISPPQATSPDSCSRARVSTQAHGPGWVCWAR